jgi:hypothetical protein
VLRLAHFFESTLRREEISSAFLAMVLEGVPRFRRHFFRLVVPDEETSLGNQKWRVTVEQEREDVRMDGGNTVIVIENKLTAAAKQQGQMLRYYLREKKQNPTKRIIAVFIAPRGVGRDEIARVTSSTKFQSNPQDVAQNIAWEELAEYTPCTDDPFDALVRNGLDEVRRAIIEAKALKYTREGDRETIRNIVDQAFGLLKERTAVPLHRWSEKNKEEILTTNTNITMHLDAVFDTEEETPFLPVNMRDADGRICITIRSQFKLAGKVKKDSALAQWWRTKTRMESLEVPGVGPHRLQENGWFVHTRSYSGTEESVTEALTETGAAVLSTLNLSLSSGDFKLNLT